MAFSSTGTVFSVTVATRTGTGGGGGGFLSPEQAGRNNKVINKNRRTKKDKKHFKFI
jgi:hypothetical protein